MKPDLLGQLTTLATLIAANPSINQQTKLAAHNLVAHAKHSTPEILAKEIDQLTQEIRLLVK